MTAEQTSKPTYYIASFSGGKDSTAMVLRLIELKYPLHEVLCCDTTMEFPAMIRHIEKVRQKVEAAGIKFTMLRAEHDFEYYLLQYKPKRKNPELEKFNGHGWPTSRVRWCTATLKTRIIDRYLRDLRQCYTVRQYVGLAADEQYRLERKSNQQQEMLHPLVEWGWTEADAMAYCRKLGYTWEGLYDIFQRVSCWLCPLQPLEELRKLWRQFPDLWEHLRYLDDRTWTNYKMDYKVRDLEKRFALEEALEAIGEKTNTKAFYADLRRYLAGETTIEEIVDLRHTPEQMTLL